MADLVAEVRERMNAGYPLGAMDGKIFGVSPVEDVVRLIDEIERLRAIETAAQEISLMADLGVLVDAVANQNASESRQFRNLRAALNATSDSARSIHSPSEGSDDG